MAGAIRPRNLTGSLSAPGEETTGPAGGDADKGQGYGGRSGGTDITPGLGDGGEGGDVGSDLEPGPAPVEPPAPAPVEPPNTPLSIPGTFARPGTLAGAAFRSPSFLTNRVQGGGNMGKGKRFGPGTQISGGGLTPFGADEDEMVRQITAYLRG
jgi:hypothetical protein